MFYWTCQEKLDSVLPNVGCKPTNVHKFLILLFTIEKGGFAIMNLIEFNELLAITASEIKITNIGVSASIK